MAWRVERNPNGPGYVLRDSESREYYGQRGDGSYMTFESEREAADYQEREEAWSRESSDRGGGGEGGQLEEQIAEESRRRADSRDPESQRERMDRGEARGAGYGPGGYRGGSGALGGGGGGYGGGGGGGGGVSDFDEASADIPVWGWLSGASARRDAANAADAEARNRAIWGELADYMPTADDLAVEYEQEGFIGGPERSELGQAQADAGSITAQRDALRALQEVYQSGGMTAADRARQRMAQMETGRAMRANREADMAALQARGIGGGGADIASMLSAQSGGANALAMQDASMLQDAQRRALQAMQASGQAAGQMRGQSFDEAATRGSAVDDFNRWQTDYARGREGRNTGWRNRTRESRSEARETAYGMRERQASGMTNQYQGDQSRRLAEGQRQDATNQATAGLIGTTIYTLAGG